MTVLRSILGAVPEVLVVSSGSGGSVKTVTAAATGSSIRGLPAGTYFIEITAGPDSAANGIYSLQWEDLD